MFSKREHGFPTTAVIFMSMQEGKLHEPGITDSSAVSGAGAVTDMGLRLQYLLLSDPGPDAFIM